MSFVARWKWVVLGVSLWLLAGWLGAPEARGQKGAAKAGPDEGTTASPLYYGVSACSNKGCHSEPPEKWLKGKELICRCVESKVWTAKDKHDTAYKVLEQERGKRMGELLGYKEDPRTWKACLTCHAFWVEDKKLLGESFDIREGVNCVACHGAYSDWFTQHSNIDFARKFRALDRPTKWATHGMKDLWDPLKRAELCASCHVGNRAEGKFVTHEMYAAGHPPLPGFEPATFSNEMPRHWQYLREKSPALQKELGLAAGELEETKLLF
ncbi:MAG: multiheme c-type cytochrome, partial [Gemmataceae bacterium]